MLASDGKLAGQATVADADVGEARFVAQVVNGQFGVFTMQTSGSWVYVLNANASVPPGTTLSERFELATRDASGLGTRPVVNVYIKGPDLVVSAAGNAPAATPTPVTAPASVAPAASAPASTQPLQSSPLDGGAGDAPLGPMSPYAAPAAKGVALPGSAPASQRTGSPSDPATQSSEPQQAQQPAAPAAAPADPAAPAPAPAGTGDQAAAEPSVEASPEQVVLLDELMNFADSGSGVLSAFGVAAAMTMGKGQRIQWQDSKKAQPSRQRIQW
jgi:VCBS repeat-containing protein